MMTRQKDAEEVTGTVAIGDMGYALERFADSYKTLYAAIKEFVTNSIEPDAQASEVVITFYGVGRNPYLAIRDNGLAMDRQFLIHVAESICASMKRGKSGFTGRHGIGMPSAAKHLEAKRLIVASKPEVQRKTYTLEFPLEGEEIEYRVYEDDQRRIHGQGTTVFLYGMPRRARRSIASVMSPSKKTGASRLAEYLGTAFRAQILGHQLRIRLERRGGRIPKDESPDEWVMPVKFEGTPVDINPIRLGPKRVIEFELYLSTPGTKTGKVSIQHFAGPLVSDITSLDDFRGHPWDKVQGEIRATFLERTGGGVSTAHRSYLRFRHCLKEVVEPLLREMYRRLIEESITREEVGQLRDIFRKVLGGESLIFRAEFVLPSTHVISADGQESDLTRSTLGGERGTIEQKGLGREPFAGPSEQDAPVVSSTPVPKPQKEVKARRVGALQWNLGPFPDAEKNLYYKLVRGVIFVNSSHAGYSQYINPQSHKKKGVKRRTLKILWMAMITCMVLVDINMSPEEYGEEERKFAYGILCGRAYTQILA